jgi:hypothetical protein
MMDAFELNNFLHAQINPRLEIKAPEILKIKNVKLNPYLKPNILSTEINQSQSSFPWIEVIILGGVIILTFIFIDEILKRQNYNNIVKKKDDQRSIYQ